MMYFTVRVTDGVTSGGSRLPRVPSTGHAGPPMGAGPVFQATRRGITYLDAVMEDMHVWTMDTSGNNLARTRWQESIIARVRLRWNPEGRFIYFTLEDRGNVRLCRHAVIRGRARAGCRSAQSYRQLSESWSVARGRRILRTPSRAPQTLPELYLAPPGGSRETAYSR